MEKKYHPIVTFKSLIVEFLHAAQSLRPKSRAIILKCSPISPAKTSTCTRQTNAFVARLDGFKSVQPTRTTFEAAIDSRHHSI